MKTCMLGDTHCQLSKGITGSSYVFSPSIASHLNIAPCPGLKVGVLGFIISSNAYTSSIFNTLAQ